MTEQKSGYYLPDGSFRNEQQIKRDMAMNGDMLPRFDTPLPQERGFGYWSQRFRDRSSQYQETAEVKNLHVEITLPGDVACINFLGDTHVGSPHVDYDRIHREVETIVNTPQSYVMLMGDLVDGFFFNSVIPEVMVRFIFVPVSPSGTGNTLSAFTFSALRFSKSAPNNAIAAKSDPLIARLPKKIPLPAK